MLDACETDKRKEVSRYQNEIQKLDDDIELVQEKLHKIKNQDILSEEAQTQCNELNQFESEAKKSLRECQKIIEPALTIDGQDPKMVIYDL